MNDYDTQVEITLRKLENNDIQEGDVFTEFLSHFELILERNGDNLTILNSTQEKIYYKSIKDFKKGLYNNNDELELLFIDNDIEWNRIIIKNVYGKMRQNDLKQSRSKKLFLLSLKSTKYGSKINLNEPV
jgi:hypothetical protein